MRNNILFIGNSYTFYNDMPEAIFAPMAERAGYPCDVTSVTHGGYHLYQFADPENEDGKRLRATIAGNHYDAVVLQDHSIGPIFKREEFEKAVGDLMTLLDGQADQFVLYATWGRHPDSPDLARFGLKSSEMTAKLSDAYNQVGARYGIKVAEVGKAFADRRAAHPEDELYNPDLTHPSALGSTVAAETILREIMRP
ncbi:MAG: SGNH/GDSL hydrolase family protein [Clostridia bacterium]|nr:SGNH/GDSL hydrolase family protein [Clostridia bacterium]